MLRKLFFALWLFTASLLFAAGGTDITVSLQTTKQSELTSEVTVVMTNTTDKPLKVLSWQTPLEATLTANIFSVTQKGKPLPYTGISVKRGAPTDADYVLFQPGESRSVTVNLSQYYKMENIGEYAVGYRGHVKFAPGSSNKSVADAHVSPKTATVVTDPVSFSFTPAEKKTVDAKLAAAFEYCDATQISTLNSAHDAAIGIAGTAASDMNAAPVPTSAPRYAEWFGAPDTTRHNTVTGHFNDVMTILDGEQVTFSCDCSAVSDPDTTFAYVYASSQDYVYHICGAFWNADLLGTDSQAGTLVHESIHFVDYADTGDTTDYAYGQSACRDLADSTPDDAVHNPDSHEYFAENTPVLSMDEPAGYTISGYVKDAATGTGIAGATVTLTGAGTGSTYTSADGYYAFTALSNGTYTVTATIDGYNSDTSSTTITDADRTVNLNILSLNVSSDYKVVLTWGASPTDLDSHLWVATSAFTGCYDLVYYGDMSEPPYASLDVDDISSYGPETITISQLSYTGDHEYWVHNYSTTPNMTTSGATVKVYKGATLVKTYTIPANTEDSSHYWHVFDIGPGGITTVNELHSDEIATCMSHGASRVLPALFQLLLN